MTASSELRDRAVAWIASDVDEQDRAELTALLADDSPEAAEDLAARFAPRLRFGPEGLRGQTGAGPARVNRATVTTATAAVADWLLSREPAAAQAGVIIGSDGRCRGEAYAEQAARVLAGAGIRVVLLPGGRPGPFLVYGVRFFDAAAGIMIGAGNGPATENGYRVYAADGAQLVPPADTDIDAAIERAGPASSIAVAPPDSPLVSRPGEELARAYLDRICSEFGPAPASAAWLRFAYTPLHGVAGDLALRAFEQAGFTAPDVVEAQLAPDPGFPTVRVPSVEETGSLDLAVAVARRSAADLVLATDADGGRLAVAVADAAAAGGFRQLTGDQVGALLGAFVLGRLAAQPGVVMAEQLVASTVLCGSLLAKIAAAAGAQHVQTPAGFGWLARAGDLRDGLKFAYGYSEDLGYAVSGAVRDADGISAALAVLGLAAAARAVGESLQDAYDGLELAHGVHLGARLAVAGSAPVDVMSRLRVSPPVALAGLPVTGVTDYTGGSWDLPSADMLSFRVPGARVMIWPGSTEQVTRAYVEVVEPLGGRPLASARQDAEVRLGELRVAVTDVLGA